MLNFPGTDEDLNAGELGDLSAIDDENDTNEDDTFHEAEQDEVPFSESVNKEEIIEEISHTVESRNISDKQNEGEQMTAEDLEMINKAAQLVNSNIKLDDVLKNIVDVATSLTRQTEGHYI